MQIEFIKALWGMEGLPVLDAIAQIRAAGFDGIEAPLGNLPHADDTAGLAVIGMAFNEDGDTFRREFELALETGVAGLTVHAGKDWFSFEQGCAYFESALRTLEGSPMPVWFETHRGRLLSNPWSTRAYLERFPTLDLCADLSHWTCVCESMLGDQSEALDLALRRSTHVHARVGHEEGPQVPDPRVEQWNSYVERFEGWWDTLRDAAAARGQATLRVVPEFGPPNYLWTNPADGRPLADLFEVCTWMRDRLRTRWSA